MRSVADQEIRKYLRDAERSIRHAADLCNKVISENQKEDKGRSESRRAIDVKRQLENILGHLMSIGHITPLLSRDDPDMFSEKTHSRIAAEKRAEKSKKEINGEGK